MHTWHKAFSCIPNSQLYTLTLDMWLRLRTPTQSCYLALCRGRDPSTQLRLMKTRAVRYVHHKVETSWAFAAWVPDYPRAPKPWMVYGRMQFHWGMRVCEGPGW